MKKTSKKFQHHAVNIVSITLIVACFLCAMFLVETYAEESCFDRIEETGRQMSTMLVHAMEDRQEKLTVFADILAANNENPEDLLQVYMENFCRTQFFSAVCIHRANGTEVSYGNHPHNTLGTATFDDEISKLPYVSKVFSYGSAPEENFIFQAVPIVRNGQTIAVLYGYMSLDLLPDMIVSTSYEGKCRLYVVDGDTGNFLMDNFYGELGNIWDRSLADRETKPGYNLNAMIKDMKAGDSGFFVFRSAQTGEWCYAYYIPMGINNWSMMLTIDEPTAFGAYRTSSRTMMVLMVLVIGLMVILVISLMNENRRVNRLDKERLHRSNFINSVQKSLLNAYTNSDSLFRALKTVADEVQAETVLLLSFKENVIVNAQYWPSSDKAQAMDLIGRNIREEFPMLYDMLSMGSSVIYDKENRPMDVSNRATELFRSVDVNRMLLVPILDTADGLRGAISAVNVPGDQTADLIESVVYDFFMAITNLESHSIIKKMGAYDYLTGMKNRNSFESEVLEFATMDGENLWCTYVDVNGLHDLNNRYGHKAGDVMLCTVAETIRRIYGSEYAYRLGGDEFAVFRLNSSHEEHMRFKYRLTEELARKNYSVSIGFESVEKNRSGVFDVDRVIAEAEQIMYRDKRRYYEENGISAERGHFPGE